MAHWDIRNALGRDGRACFRRARADLRYLTAIRRSHSSLDIFYPESLGY
jgi:hypothetical protein